MTRTIVQTPISQRPIRRRPSDRGVMVFLACIAIFALGYLFSTWLLSVYQEGDQRHYNTFWTAMTWSNPRQWGEIQTRYLGSNDILYSAIASFGANTGFERIAYISFWNGILTSLAGYLLFKYRASLIFSILLFSNYYFLVLLGPAERLKFAYLLLLLAACLTPVKLKLAASILSIFFHTQAIIQFASSAIYKISSEYKAILADRRMATLFFAIGPIFVFAAAYYLYSNSGDVLSQKSEYYANKSQGVLEIVQWFLLLGAGMLVFEKRVPYLMSMIPMGALTFLFGNRINVATLALFLTLALVERKTAHPLVLAVMAYMSFKSIDFLTRVVATGQGFA